MSLNQVFDLMGIGVCFVGLVLILLTQLGVFDDV
jgi:hypothetical protein